MIEKRRHKRYVLNNKVSNTLQFAHVNSSIKYKGVEYDDIKQLSGGEGDRISLALILSLNQVSSSPIVMLDECISSLDGTLKEACINSMKTLSGKTIICVDHEGVEGYYDKTIEVMP